MDFIGLYEDHPDPSVTNGVNYRSIYKYFASLLRGHIPVQLDAASATKVISIYQQLMQIIDDSLPEAQVTNVIILKNWSLLNGSYEGDSFGFRPFAAQEATGE